MSHDLYSPRVLELAADIPHVGLLASPNGRAHRVSRLCGSRIDLDLTLDEGHVSAAGIEPKACALGQASASILMRHILGASPDEIRNARDSFRAMLKEAGPPPTGRFWELRYLEAVRDYPPRHASALLAFEAACDALDEAEKSVGKNLAEAVLQARQVVAGEN
ncbi:iron-sulfur cluster assembly scaffold protein IscU [Candidatus Phycosocius bacilliformis]|uniref:Iron-sulfur cluster assembly scaffold protein IscU n=1 Tax=Candidatus Phycosocius bacilliformis TaxID=1445552 RepID=A0A2P2E6U1_9PROT|nr:iron-sulfur cluster assembly scaffold protein [Candidatus Phycosocius bacilliformis]GBF56776.1 iron-sulfur cluster assembly scaffold protein IscU [Candidatus Phycosocius bacilliformis]